MILLRSLRWISFDTVAIGALIELGIIASDETPANADMDFMRDKVSSVHAALDAQEVNLSGHLAASRARSSSHTLELAAAYAASSFGKAVDPQVVAMLEAPNQRKERWILSSNDNAQRSCDGHP